MIEDTLFKQYLQDRLEHLNQEERSVMQAVLGKYTHVFHREGGDDFQGTDVVEHRIIKGDVKPIRKPPYRVPFALSKEMNDQIQDMLNPLPALTYQTVLDLNAACRSKRTETYWLFSS